MRDTVHCILCVLVTLVLGVLLMRYATDLWMLAFFESLQTHLALAAMAGALLTLLIKRHWYGVVLLVVGAALVAHSIVMLQEFSAAPPAANVRPTYRLLSFNIDNDNFANGAAIADLILDTDADVVEIFEASPLLSQMQRISEAYPYRVGCGVMTEDCDSLLLSKRPFLNQQIRSLSFLWSQRFILTTIDMDGQPVNFASAHLSKPYFDEFHTDELQILYHILQLTKGPLLLAGDFNASVIAPDMQHFLGETGLRHVFPEPPTWPIEAGPLGISIDHVFARAPLRLKSVQRIKDAMGSNHYGLISEFTVAK